jgi:hypothetical protein
MGVGSGNGHKEDADFSNGRMTLEVGEARSRPRGGVPRIWVGMGRGQATGMKLMVRI